MSPKTRAGVAIAAVATLLIGTAMAQDPSLSQVYQAAESGNLTQAQRMMDEVLRTHPNSAKADFVEAELLARQGRSAAAEAELNTAQRLEPGLPFARPQAVGELKRRITSSRALYSPGRAIAPATGSGISWTTVLFGAAIIALIFVVVRAMRRSTSTYLPAGSGTAYGAPPMTGYGATAPVQPPGRPHGPGRRWNRHRHSWRTRNRRGARRRNGCGRSARASSRRRTQRSQWVTCFARRRRATGSRRHGWTRLWHYRQRFVGRQFCQRRRRRRLELGEPGRWQGCRGRGSLRYAVGITQSRQCGGTPPLCRRASAKQRPQQVEQHADATADQRAIEADELQVLANLELDFLRHIPSVPTLDDIGDEQRDLVPVSEHQRLQSPCQPLVELVLHHFVPCEP